MQFKVLALVGLAVLGMFLIETSGNTVTIFPEISTAEDTLTILPPGSLLPFSCIYNKHLSKVVIYKNGTKVRIPAGEFIDNSSSVQDCVAFSDDSSMSQCEDLEYPKKVHYRNMTDVCLPKGKVVENLNTVYGCYNTISWADWHTKGMCK